MDLLKDNVGKLYRKFFIASFGSALIACIYGLVDMAMVGQYHGPGRLCRNGGNCPNLEYYIQLWAFVRYRRLGDLCRRKGRTR